MQSERAFMLPDYSGVRIVAGVIPSVKSRGGDDETHLQLLNNAPAKNVRWY